LGYIKGKRADSERKREEGREKREKRTKDSLPLFPLLGFRVFFGEGKGD
jgi:hypothetical protein